MIINIDQKLIIFSQCLKLKSISQIKPSHEQKLSM